MMFASWRHGTSAPATPVDKAFCGEGAKCLPHYGSRDTKQLLELRFAGKRSSRWQRMVDDLRAEVAAEL